MQGNSKMPPTHGQQQQNTQQDLPSPSSSSTASRSPKSLQLSSSQVREEISLGANRTIQSQSVSHEMQVSRNLN